MQSVFRAQKSAPILTLREKMVKFSIIIPVYNRPEEVVELLDSLTMQQLRNELEVIVVEDGSQLTCEREIQVFEKQLNLKYIKQSNAGPGGARNNGAKLAEGKYLIFLDSDCVLPSNYLELTAQHLEQRPLSCFGGPDRAHKFFTPIQKAISHSMTSLFTTGGIRGGRKKMDKFYPRSFNLGVEKSVFEAVGGFSDMRYGEDVDFSMRVVECGYKIGLIEETFVYHKRRTNFYSFFKQVFSSGTARVDIASRHRGALKIVHLLPTAFVLSVPIVALLSVWLGAWVWLIYVLHFLLLFTDALHATRSVHVALLAYIAGLIQVSGYGLGFLTALWMKFFRKKKGHYVAFRKTFYK